MLCNKLPVLFVLFYRFIRMATMHIQNPMISNESHPVYWDSSDEFYAA